MGVISFREAKSSDAGRLGVLHVTSWRESYAGLLPGPILDGLSAEARSNMWRAILEDPAKYGGTGIFVAESDDKIVAFGACGDQRDPALKARGFEGEVGAIYVLQSHQRAGVGSSLMSLMAQAFWTTAERLPPSGCCERMLLPGYSTSGWVALWQVRSRTSCRG